MNYILSFLLAIILTSLSYFGGSLLWRRNLTILQSFIIGTSVVSIGAITEALGAPIWLIVFIPFPVGMFLLYVFLKETVRNWLITYLTILALYTVIHLIMSYFFHYHSLIPAWTLS